MESINTSTANTETIVDVREKYKEATTASSEKSQLGADAFLKLLMVQLSNQNPMEPMKDMDFIAQMSSFNALEQMKQLNEGFVHFANDQKGLSYLDKEVRIEYTPDKDRPFEKKEVIGVVSAIQKTDAGDTFVKINNNQYKVSEIREVYTHTPTSAA